MSDTPPGADAPGPEGAREGPPAHGRSAGSGIWRAVGGGVRLATAGAVVYFMTLKVLAADPVWWVAPPLLALILLPPSTLVARWMASETSNTPRRRLRWVCFGPRLWVQRRGPALRWTLRGLFCGGMAVLSLVPLHRADPLPEARVLWDDPHMPAYDATLDPDGRVLYVSHAHARLVGGANGVSRVDLDTGEVKSRRHDDDHGHYLTLFPDAGELLVHSYREPTPEDPSAPAKIGHVYYLDPDSLALRAERACRQGYPIRSYRLLSGDMLTVCKDEKLLIRSEDRRAPCGPTAQRIPVGSDEAGGEVDALEHLTFLTGAPHLAWATGEGGGDGCLMNLAAGEAEACVPFGQFVWSTAIEPRSGHLWVARPAHHRIDVRDARSGAWIGGFPVNGVPRPLAFDREAGLAFVGMYFSGNVAVVDVETLEILAEVGAGGRLRRLLMNPSRGTLIAVGAGQILSYPLAPLRRAARGTAAEGTP